VYEESMQKFDFIKVQYDKQHFCVYEIIMNVLS